MSSSPIDISSRDIISGYSVVGTSSRVKTLSRKHMIAGIHGDLIRDNIRRSVMSELFDVIEIGRSYKITTRERTENRSGYDEYVFQLRVEEL